MREATTRQRRGWAVPPGLRRVLACWGAAVAVLLVQVLVPSAALAETTEPTPTSTATQTAAGLTPTSTTTAGAADSTTGTATATGTPTGTKTATPAPSPSPAPPGDGEDALTPEEVAAQVAQATRLRGALAQSDAQLAALGEQLAQAAVKAASALQRARQAELDEQAAEGQLHEQVERLAQLQAEQASSKQDMGRWARSAYVAGGTISTYEGWIAVLQSDAVDDSSHDLAVLEHLGVLNGQELDRLRDAAARQRTVAGRAAAAAHAASTAAAAAAAATPEADVLLEEQRLVLVRLQAEQLRTVGSAELTREELARSKNADAIAAAAQLAAALRNRHAGTAVPIDPDQCKGLSTAGYANGQIPAAALCPVWGAPNQMLRGDAARAFTALSREYAKTFGRPICITDSYRSRSQQVALYGIKPTLAARPGTSNHGWGTAADLCGGIESFGTTQHAWLLAHAPLYGWFHPSWAQPTGSRPEPWHWEYAG
jgi:hypothetical protein